MDRLTARNLNHNPKDNLQLTSFIKVSVKVKVERLN